MAISLDNSHVVSRSLATSSRVIAPGHRVAIRWRRGQIRNVVVAINGGFESDIDIEHRTFKCAIRYRQLSNSEEVREL
jgi:hypothetical protein